MSRGAKRKARGRKSEEELTIATHNVRTMAVDGKHGVGRAVEVLSKYEERDCDIIGLQETRRSGQSALVETGYVVNCSGEGGGKKGQGGVGLAIRRHIIRAQKHSPEGDARIVRSSQSCHVCCCVCPNRHSNCFKKALFLDSFGQGREGGARTRTAVCVDGCKRTDWAARRGGIWE